MKKFLLPILGLMLIITACAAPATQPPLHEPATETLAPATNTSQPTFTATVPPATDTATPAPTETALPAGETTVGVSFANDIMPIFNNSCNKCHGIEQIKEGFDMTSYDTLMAGSFNGSVITPGSAVDSFLVEQLLTGEMPKRGPKLTPEQIQIIADWVNAGAQNN